MDGHGPPEMLPVEMADVPELLEQLLLGLKDGSVRAITLRMKAADGTVLDFAFGYETQEEKDAALAKLLRVLGELQ
jgi:hypothetical protein